MIGFCNRMLAEPGRYGQAKADAQQPPTEYVGGVMHAQIDPRVAKDENKKE